MTFSHLKVSPSDISPFVLLPGDPKRVDEVGKYLNDFRIIANNREFRIGIGFYNDIKITVCSTGIGCPSTAIVVEELIRIGAKYLIRIGTCGGAWRSDIPIGSLVIPTACVRDEGTTVEYIPLGFPAVADSEIFLSLYNNAIKNNKKCFLGINRTHDAFCGEKKSITKWGDYLLDDSWKNNVTPILSSDMESSALFVIASLRGVKAGAILAVNADSEPLINKVSGMKQIVSIENDPTTTQDIVKSMIEVALTTISSFKN